MMSPKKILELEDFVKEAFDNGTPIPEDVVLHATILIGNGWPVAKAIEESKRTLDEAELEGGY